VQARIIPNLDPVSIENNGERLFYQAAAELPADYTVFYSCKYVLPGDEEHPALTTLINTKKDTAKAQGVDFAVAIKSDFSKLNIPPWDLNSMLGNLIESAMEAAVYDKHPRVAVELNHQNGQYVIYIANNGETIRDKDKIYEPGYTTKGSLSRGYGLFLVKQLAEQYGGNITVISNRKTHVTVQIPDGEGGLGDDKFYMPEDCRSLG
jgi:two-component system sensor histidine kinase AgrC